MRNFNSSLFSRISFSLFLSCVFSLSANAQDKSAAEIRWMTFEEAVAASDKNPKKILIDVYTGWCGWCKKLDNVTYKDPKVVEYVNKHYYAVKLDAEMKDTVRFREHVFINENPTGNRSAHQLAKSLLSGQMSYPTTVIMDEGFNLATAPIKGYHDAKDLLPILTFFGDNIYRNTSWEDYQKKVSQSQ